MKATWRRILSVLVGTILAPFVIFGVYLLLSDCGRRLPEPSGQIVYGIALSSSISVGLYFLARVALPPWLKWIALIVYVVILNYFLFLFTFLIAGLVFGRWLKERFSDWPPLTLPWRLTGATGILYNFSMNSTVTITELQGQAPRIVRRAEKSGSVSVARHGRTVAFLVSRERMEAILETIEIISDRRALKAIRDYERGKLRLTRFDPDEI